MVGRRIFSGRRRVPGVRFQEPKVEIPGADRTITAARISAAISVLSHRLATVEKYNIECASSSVCQAHFTITYPLTLFPGHRSDIHRARRLIVECVPYASAQYCGLTDRQCYMSPWGSQPGGSGVAVGLVQGDQVQSWSTIFGNPWVCLADS